MPDGSNPFLVQQNIPGVGNISTPRPMFSAGGQFAPGIFQAGGQIAKESMNAVNDFLAKRGLTSSSFLPVGLSRAFRGGVMDASQMFQQQQQMFGNLANQQMQMMAALGPEQQKPSFGQSVLGGTAAGAGVGSMFGPAGAGVGAGIGAGVGALDQLFNLGIFG
jgi:hypothetical protein